MIPSSLKKQLPEAEREGLVINRGFEKHLVIYTKKEWDQITGELSKLNLYEKNAAILFAILPGELQSYRSIPQIAYCFQKL